MICCLGVRQETGTKTVAHRSMLTQQIAIFILESERFRIVMS